MLSPFPDLPQHPHFDPTWLTRAEKAAVTAANKGNLEPLIGCNVGPGIFWVWTRSLHRRFLFTGLNHRQFLRLLRTFGLTLMRGSAGRFFVHYERFLLLIHALSYCTNESPFEPLTFYAIRAKHHPKLLEGNRETREAFRLAYIETKRDHITRCARLAEALTKHRTTILSSLLTCQHIQSFTPDPAAYHAIRTYFDTLIDELQTRINATAERFRKASDEWARTLKPVSDEELIWADFPFEKRAGGPFKEVDPLDSTTPDG